MMDIDLPYPSEQTKTARLPLLIRRARALRQREQRYDEHQDLDSSVREYPGIDRAGDWIEQASGSAACDIAPTPEYGT